MLQTLHDLAEDHYTKTDNALMVGLFDTITYKFASFRSTRLPEGPIPRIQHITAEEPWIYHVDPKADLLITVII